MVRKGKLIRPVTREECPFLTKDLENGKIVYEYSGCTYGAISHVGIAVTDKPGREPFYEVPRNAIAWYPRE